MKRVCVFLGSREGTAAQRAAARAFGQRAAQRRIGIVYGGCSTGLMGALADGACDAGGEVIGVLPAMLTHREPGHARLTRLEGVADMSVRKQRMGELSDAFVALPGGYGTLDELFEVLTERIVGVHNKPVALLNVAGYFDAQLVFLRRAVSDGLLPAHDLERLMVFDDVDALLTALGFSQ